MIPSSTPGGTEPAKASATNTALSSAWPITVEPIVRVQSQRPRVRIFIFARTKELANSPARYATKEAASIRGVCPRISLYAAPPFQNAPAAISTPSHEPPHRNCFAQMHCVVRDRVGAEHAAAAPSRIGLRHPLGAGTERSGGHRPVAIDERISSQRSGRRLVATS